MIDRGYGDALRTLLRRSPAADLKLSRGYVVYPGREPYSPGRGVTALPAEGLLGRPARLASL